MVVLFMDKGNNSRWDDSFLQKVKESLRPFFSLAASKSLTPNPSIIVGVSGGADSLSLLHCLHRIVSPSALVVAHLNHGLRAQADEDAKFVTQIAKKWGILCEAKKVDVAQLADGQGWGIEEAGRHARYAFFAEVAQQHDAVAVVVAHNADDQAETILMHLLRGSGLAGLRGMSLVGDVPGNEAVMLLRPFLNISRKDIETYCQMHNLDPREDESNQQTIYLRNQIRHELLPKLENFNPQIKKHLQQLGEVVAADYEVLLSAFAVVWQAVQVAAGDGWLQLSRNQFQSLPVSQQRMALRAGILQIRPLQTEISFQVIEQARMLALQNRAGTQIDLPGKVTLLVDYQLLSFTISTENIPVTVPQIASVVTLPIPGKIELQNGWGLQAEIVDLDVVAVQRQATDRVVFVDVDEAKNLQVRGRLAGERIQPLGMDGKSSKLKDVMINRKMARPYRQNWPLVVKDEQPVWLVGQMMDHRVKLTSKTERIIKLRCYQLDDA